MKISRKFKISSALLIAALALSMTACEKNEKTITSLANAKVSNIVSSECLQHEAKGMHNADSVIVSYNNGTIHITHYNVTVNCGFKNVNVDLDIYGDTIKIIEWGYPNSANCLCEIENSFEINNVPHGTYVIIMENWEPEPYCQTFKF